MSHTSRTFASIGWYSPGWSSKPPKGPSTTWFLPVSNFKEIFLLRSSYLQTSIHKSMSLCLNLSISMNQTVGPGANDWQSTHFLAITKIYLLFKVLWILNYIIRCLITAYWRSNSYDFSSFLLTSVAPSQTTHVFSASSPSLLHGTQEPEASSILIISFFIVLQRTWGSVTTWVWEMAVLCHSYLPSLLSQIENLPQAFIGNLMRCLDMERCRIRTPAQF